MEINREIDSEINRAINMEINREINKQITMEINREINRGINREIDMEINRELNRETMGHGMLPKPPSLQRTQQSPFFACSTQCIGLRSSLLMSGPAWAVQAT